VAGKINKKRENSIKPEGKGRESKKTQGTKKLGKTASHLLTDLAQTNTKRRLR
jgi:hypothetical protein